MKASKHAKQQRRSKRKTGQQPRAKKPQVQQAVRRTVTAPRADAEPRLAKGTAEVPPLAQHGFTEIEEAFFEAGVALSAEHATAASELQVAEPPRTGWWARLWSRNRAPMFAWD